MRASTAAGPVASAGTGRTNELAPPLPGDREPAKAHGEARRRARRASRNSGIAASEHAGRGERQLARRAVGRPGSAPRSARRAEPPGRSPPRRPGTASSSVAGSRSPITCDTGRLRRHGRAEVAGEQVAEVVRRTAATAGRPGRAPARRASTSSAGAVMPSAARTGSPGTRWIIRNAAVSSTHSDDERIASFCVVRTSAMGRPGFRHARRPPSQRWPSAVHPYRGRRDGASADLEPRSSAEERDDRVDVGARRRRA